nr:protein YgfX [Chromobacterium sp. ASV5]
MPSRPQLPPFALSLRPSPCWLALVASAWLLSSLAILAHLPWHWAGLVPVEALLALWALRANGWWARDFHPCLLQVDAYGALTLHYPDGREEPAQVLDDSFVSPWLIVLNVKAAGRRRSVMLWPDSAAAEGRRQLRVYLLWFAAEPQADLNETV